MDEPFNSGRQETYSWRSAFLWGNFIAHCKKARKGRIGDRVIHSLIAAVELLPIIGQITSVCEKLIIDNYNSKKDSNRLVSLQKKNAQVGDSAKSQNEFSNLTDSNSMLRSGKDKAVLASHHLIGSLPKASSERTKGEEAGILEDIGAEPGRIIGVRQVFPGVFTAEGRTAKGEPIYFGMELINDASRKIWKDYSQTTYNHCFFGLLKNIRLNIGNSKKLQEIQKGSGFSESQFEALTKQFCERGLTRNGRLKDAFEDVLGGVAGFMIDECEKGIFASATYVAYISKTPVTGYLSAEASKGSLVQFRKNYDNILMSVGVRLDTEKPLFENRGIFRNPFSIIDGGYSNIATQLHAFTGKVMRECINNTLADKKKLFMSVSPIAKMKDILIDKIGLAKIKMKTDIPEELRVETSGVDEEQFLINLDDLANLHS